MLQDQRGALWHLAEPFSGFGISKPWRARSIMFDHRVLKWPSGGSVAVRGCLVFLGEAGLAKIDRALDDGSQPGT